MLKPPPPGTDYINNHLLTKLKAIADWRDAGADPAVPPKYDEATHPDTKDIAAVVVFYKTQRPVLYVTDPDNKGLSPVPEAQDYDYSEMVGATVTRIDDAHSVVFKKASALAYTYWWKVGNIRYHI